MKNNLQNFGTACWRILSEVPGWPDAPRNVRMRRVLPIVLPLLAMAFLFLWNRVWILPRIHAEMTTFQPLLRLEQEVADMKLSGSDAQAAEAATRAAETGRMMLADPKQLAPSLESSVKMARTLGWEAVFHPLPVTAITTQPDALVSYVTARGKLVPAADNTQPFQSLLVLLERLSPPDRSIDLTRLTIRADEQGRQTAEVFLRAGCLIPNEKTAQ